VPLYNKHVIALELLDDTLNCALRDAALLGDHSDSGEALPHFIRSVGQRHQDKL
jgi:hypothetical protein